MTTVSEYKQEVSHYTSSNKLKKGSLIIKLYNTVLKLPPPAVSYGIRITKLPSFIIFSYIFFPQENGYLFKIS